MAGEKRQGIENVILFRICMFLWNMMRCVQNHRSAPPPPARGATPPPWGEETALNSQVIATQGFTRDTKWSPSVGQGDVRHQTPAGGLQSHARRCNGY